MSSVRGSIQDLLATANGEKRRNFVETVELQIKLDIRPLANTPQVRPCYPLPTTALMLESQVTSLVSLAHACPSAFSLMEHVHRGYYRTGECTSPILRTGLWSVCAS